MDFDYHCGNGLYHSLKGDNRFLYINFHAYHYGAFWPYEEEYDYDNKYGNNMSSTVVLKWKHLKLARRLRYISNAIIRNYCSNCIW